MAAPLANDLALKAFSRSGLYETLTATINGSGTLIITATRTGRNALVINIPSSATAVTVASPNLQEQSLQTLADICAQIMQDTMPN